MWRKLTVLLFLLILVQVANASPISKVINHQYSSQTNVTVFEQQVDPDVKQDDINDLYNLPRSARINPSLFTAEIQTTPVYILIVEFFKVKLTAGVFKHLANPPVISPWFEQLSHKNNTSRLSGWKDGNALYSSCITYHS